MWCMKATAAELVGAGDSASTERRLGDAREAFAGAAIAAELEGDRAMLARALVGLGKVEREVGALELAREHYQSAAGILRTLNDRPLLAHTVRHVGDILQQQGNKGAAGACYAEALALYRDCPTTGALDLANTLRGYALLKSGLPARREAIALWEEARGLYGAAGVEAGVEEAGDWLMRLEDAEP